MPDVPGKAVLQKARDILDCSDSHTPELGVNELARRSGLPRTTARRLAQELVACELLDRSGGRYRLGAWLAELGARVPAHRSLRVAAAPYLEELTHLTHETAALALPLHGEILFSEVYVGSRGRGQVEPDEDVLEDGIAFAGVAKYPARVKCALLGWMAFKDAVAKTPSSNGESS